MNVISERPYLRFGEFNNPLRNGRMEDFGYFYYGKSAPKHSINKDAPTPCIRYGELYTKYNEQVLKIFSYTNTNPRNLRYSKGCEVLIPRVGEEPLDFTKCTFLPLPNIAIGEMISVYNTEEYGLFFVYYIREKLKVPFARVVEGANVSNLYFRYLEKIEMNIPSIDEQRKIVAFLLATSKWIENLKKQKESLEKYKKGVMQKIFSHKFRFKDENEKEFPRWEEKRLGSIAKFWNGMAHEQSISDSGKYVVVNSKFISSNGLVKKYTDNQISPLKKEDIAVVMSDIPNGKALAKCFLVPIDGLYTLNQRIGGIRSQEITSQFLISILNRNKYFLKIDNGVSQTNLRRDEVLNCPVVFPLLKEQQKIAVFLISIDKVIESKQKQIDLAESWKKGLMQRMFV